MWGRAQKEKVRRDYGEERVEKHCSKISFLRLFFFWGGGGKANGGRDLGKATACSSLGFLPNLALGNHAMMEI